MSDTNRAVHAQKMARSLRFRIKEEEEVYYPCSENKGAYQIRGYREADLRLCFRIGKKSGFLMTLLIYGHVKIFNTYDEELNKTKISILSLT